MHPLGAPELAFGAAQELRRPDHRAVRQHGERSQSQVDAHVGTGPREPLRLERGQRRRHVVPPRREAAGQDDARIVFKPRPEDDPEVRRPDITLATTRLGWKPQVSLAEGIERTLPWFRAQLGLDQGK